MEYFNFERSLLEFLLNIPDDLYPKAWFNHPGIGERVYRPYIPMRDGGIDGLPGIPIYHPEDPLEISLEKPLPERGKAFTPFFFSAQIRPGWEAALRVTPGDARTGVPRLISIIPYTREDGRRMPLGELRYAFTSNPADPLTPRDVIVYVAQGDTKVEGWMSGTVRAYVRENVDLKRVYENMEELGKLHR